MNWRIYVNGEFAFVVLNQPSAWAAEAKARCLCKLGDRIAAYKAYAP